MWVWRRTPAGKRDSGRPTWWVLLAVCLSITAVLFAHMGSRQKGTARRSGTQVASPRLNGSSAPHGGTQVTWSSGAPSRNAAIAFPTVGPETGSILAIQSPTKISAATQVSQPPVGETVHTTTSNYTGYLSYPDDITTSFSLPPGGTEVTASATWQGSGGLDLSIHCPSNVQDSDGLESTVSVSGQLLGSPCELVLSEPGESTQPVPYSLNVTVTSG